MPILLGIAVIIVVGILASFVRQLFRKQYTRAMTSLTAELGLSFSAEQQPAEPGVPGDFLLFAQGIPHSRQNVMEGIYKDVDLAVYSYTFLKDWGKAVESFTQTVIHIRNLETSIPQFSLYPQRHIEVVMHKLPTKEGKDRLLGTVGIQLRNHPDFRDQYKLFGYERQKLSAIFDNKSVIDALRVLESKPFQGLVCVEGAGLNLFIYPLYQRVPVRQLTGFLDKSVALARHIESAMNAQCDSSV